MKKILKICVLSFAVLLLLNNDIDAQKDFDGIRGTQHWMMYSDAPNSLYRYIAGQAYQDIDRRNETVSKISSLSGWQQRQKWIQKTLQESVGNFPPKTPLNAKITKSFDEGDYRLENIVYESQPGYYVTAGLFIPMGVKEEAKIPAIIYCSGHTDKGYRGYQNIIINLVKKGFIVFAFDPIGQGERLQYYNAETNKSKFPWPSYEHSYAGAQLFVTGNNLARNFIWDGIRAVDYLLTRKEVDPKRIGITGRSGGGTQSAYIAAFDERIKAAAPENYITNFTRLFESMGPQDAEQNFLYQIKRGLDMADLLEVRAPKPLLMLTTSRDMFPIQGALETKKEVDRIYNAYGKPENFQMVMDDAPHASTKKNRESMYAFFERVFNHPGDSADLNVKPQSSEELQVTKTGQVCTALNSETAFSLNYKDAEREMHQLDINRKSMPQYLNVIVQSAKKLSGFTEPAPIENTIFAGRIQREGYVIEKYLVKGEGNYMIPYLLLKPNERGNKAVIYLNPDGKAADIAVGGEMEWFAQNGVTVLAPDIIGTGELGPGVFRGDSYIDSVSYNLWFAAMDIGRSIVGIQAGDVIKLTNIVKNDLHFKEIYGVAKNQMSPLLLHAAAFDKDIQKVALISPYSSYRSIVLNEHYDPHFIQSTVAGSIGVYDLPDLAGSLAPKKLLLTGVTDGDGNTGNSKDINRDLSVIKAAYKFKSEENKLQILPAIAGKELNDAFKNWLKNN
ncbi:prolyl oligopeptidase family serine peptidase [Ginsengibacter hankyongi]|uniref:Prolyl oligopeptidase family serine peptidase n=1 Tax=Ginsengibacter hankyongi TaxID=2607284 RepID=A0A5J5IF59_9BACT|nr:acetylxylan esterase [Ginsengibacter hankyongi]KAA9038658.1 prolyl oligopeptidase family serine peptidase [Ginsengibacter hankyongi]